jgi:hypothetical protein
MTVHGQRFSYGTVNEMMNSILEVAEDEPAYKK